MNNVMPEKKIMVGNSSRHDAMSESSPLKPASLALDFGHLSTIVAIVPHEESDKCVLVRNMDMNVETPSCVAFTPKLRLFGLTARHGARSRENTAFEQLPLWLRAGAAAPDAITMREEEQQFSAKAMILESDDED